MRLQLMSDVQLGTPGLVLSDLTLSAIQAEATRAHLKHGEHSMLGKKYSSGDRLAILVEEVGEVAHELTYDSGGPGGGRRDELVKELIQVAAMAATWVEFLEGRHDTADVTTPGLVLSDLTVSAPGMPRMTPRSLPELLGYWRERRAAAPRGIAFQVRVCAEDLEVILAAEDDLLAAREDRDRLARQLTAAVERLDAIEHDNSGLRDVLAEIRDGDSKYGDWARELARKALGGGGE
jgi:hypothetical protein